MSGLPGRLEKEKKKERQAKLLVKIEKKEH